MTTYQNPLPKFPTTKHELILLLMARDKTTEEDAITIVEDFQSSVDDALDSGNYHDLDDLIQDELGLEPDYLILFI